MANSAGMIKESIWRDKDFRHLPRLAQCTYMQLLSQKDLDCAGLMTLHVAMWAKGCDEISDTDLSADLLVLEDRRFVFVDEETDELFVRGYMRSAQVIKSPNIFKSALKSAGMVESPKLKVEVAAELRRLRRAEATKLADLLDPQPTPPDGTKGSETLSEGFKGSETLPEPPRSVSVSVSGSVGIGSLWEGTPPSRFCSEHPNGTDKRCWPCKRARDAFEQWESAAGADELERKRAAKAAAEQAMRDCPLCDTAGWLLGADGTPAEPGVKCTHNRDEVAHG